MQKPIFKNDDDFEDFYENYNLEPDEQSIETQYKSIKVIKPMDILSYLKSYTFTDSLDKDYYGWKFTVNGLNELPDEISLFSQTTKSTRTYNQLKEKLEENQSLPWQHRHLF